MNPMNRGIAPIALLLLLLILLTISANVLVSAAGNNFLDDDDFSIIVNIELTWARTIAQPALTGLIMGISIFVLFVVYLGGRSNHRRFNDRTINYKIFSGGASIFLKTALLRAVFNFFFFDLEQDYMSLKLNNGLTSAMIHISRRH